MNGTYLHVIEYVANISTTLTWHEEHVYYDSNKNIVCGVGELMNFAI